MSQRDTYQLTPIVTADDAKSARDRPDSAKSPVLQESDSEDDELLAVSRSTIELAQHDRAVLEDEDEMEKLLVRPGRNPDGLRRIFSSPGANQSTVRIGRPRLRSPLREDPEMIFEMEEGALGDHEDADMPSRSSIESSMAEKLIPRPYYDNRSSKYLQFSLLALVMVAIILITSLAVYKQSYSNRLRTVVSNGTSLFGPTTIYISLDGFRADFLSRNLTPNLNSLVAEGISPRYMRPSFPSVTFPNHYTLMTGLYPESHGVVGNSFYDPGLDADFYYRDPNRSNNPKWWIAEPLWATAEKQGLRTAIHMWPGSEARIVPEYEPEVLDKFNGKEELANKVSRILGLLDLPSEHDSHPDDQPNLRPNMIAAYVPNVDADGHKYGPNSTEILTTISAVDTMIGSLLAGLESRNLTQVVNLVIVSDHGMATTHTNRTIQLDDFVDLSLVSRIDGWPLRGIRPNKPEDLHTIESQLFAAASNYSYGMEVYNLSSMPSRYHFSASSRIAPLWVIPHAGWAIVERPDFDVQVAQKNGETYRPRGIHGYDNEHPLMRAIFIARGPKFASPPGSRVAEFQNIHVYNLICESLEMTPLANNGTMTLSSLKPVGHHSDPDPEDPPVDLASNISTPAITMRPTSEPKSIMATKTKTEVTLATTTIKYTITVPPKSTAISKPHEVHWWDGVVSSLENAKDWTLGVLGFGPDPDSD